ncbi:SMC-Scp complex subunit ScpB [Porticoccus sp.]|uniref:SMC-Scp complex subunit ScpB n=1 Tax=Porticoccus sp. TaxID=2024853 RepID=UPI003F6A2B2C
MTMTNDQLKKIVEGALLAAGRSLDIGHLQNLFDIDQVPAKDQLLAVLEDIDAACSDRGFELKRTGSGYRIQVRQELSPWINRLWEEKPKKYSRALLETLALIAYRQPLTRGDIEDVRGVSVSSEIIKTLQEREWIRVVGHRDVPGRPALYATTREFLDYFSLSSLDQLPPLSEIRDIDDINPTLTLEISTQNQNKEDSRDAFAEADEIAGSGMGSRPDDNDSTEINTPSGDWQH